MIAGTVTLGGKRSRVIADLAALGRLAGAASLGIDGPEGTAESRRFLHAVIDRRDWPRWARAAAHASGEDLNAAASACIGAILAAAVNSPDPEVAEYGRGFRQAVIAFQGGNQQAFIELAAANAVMYGGQP